MFLLENHENVIALYKYIRELCLQKYNIVTDVGKQVWTCFLKDIPVDYDNITMYYRDRVEEESSPNSVLIEVKKPEFQQCPTPSKIFSSWLIPGWDRYTNEARRKETLDKIPKPLFDESYKELGVEYFGDSLERTKAYEKWLAARAVWVDKQRLINQTRSFFARLFQEYTDLERDSEVFELMVGSGLIQLVGNTAINHPILLKRVKFSFDAKDNIIRICDTDTEPELYTILLQEMTDIDHGAVKQLKDDLHNNFYHPLDRNDTPDYLKILTHKLCSDSKFVADPSERIASGDRLLTSFTPVFFVRKRIDGTVKAIDEIIHTIEETGVVPGYLIDLVGAGNITVTEDNRELTIDEQLAALSGESAQILFSKEANREQLEIAERIEKYNAVVVQGPPGTGKTHTIANLLGHFLAQGKSILVTSHTKKALSVLKEKLPPEIQNLCVSVLDDTNSDMERSVDGITSYLSKYTSNELKNRMESAERQRNEIIKQLAEVRKKIYAIKYREFDPIVYDGVGYSPAAAAAFVSTNAEELSYIPGKVRLYHPLPVATEELAQLYRSNEWITEAMEKELGFDIPNPESLPIPASFYSLVRKENEYKTVLNDLGKKLGDQLNVDFEKNTVYLRDGETSMLLVMCPTIDALEQLTQYINAFKSIDAWMINAAVDGKKNGGYKSRWEMLIEAIEDTVSFADSIVTQMFGNKITIDETVDLSQLQTQMLKALSIFQRKGKVSKLDLLFNRTLETSLSQIKINGSMITSSKECQLAQDYLILTEKRQRTAKFWNELMAKTILPNFLIWETSLNEFACNGFHISNAIWTGTRLNILNCCV